MASGSRGQASRAEIPVEVMRRTFRTPPDTAVGG